VEFIYIASFEVLERSEKNFTGVQASIHQYETVFAFVSK